MNCKKKTNIVSFFFCSTKQFCRQMSVIGARRMVEIKHEKKMKI